MKTAEKQEPRDGVKSGVGMGGGGGGKETGVHGAEQQVFSEGDR